MFDELMERLRNSFKSRLMPVTIVYLVLIGILIYRLFVLQIVSGKEYETSFTNTSSQPRVIQATRGNIYDVNGKLLAYNELAYNVTLLDTGTYADSQELNDKIFQVINIIVSHGGTIDIDDFGLEMDAKGNVEFKGTENEILRFKRDVFSHKKTSEVTEQEKAMTAQQVFEYLRDSTSVNSLKFKIDKDKYSQKEVFEIMQIRFAMYLNSYYKYNPLVIATNVSEQTVSAVKEYSGDIIGLDIQTTTIRKYNPEYAYSMAHILGYTGKISEEDYTEKSKNEDTTYSKSDQVGKTGVESQFESDLHGVNGYDTVVLDAKRRVVDVKEGKQAVAGKDIYLSIDAELQNVVYGMTERQLAGIVLDKMVNSRSTERMNKSEKEITIPIREVLYSLIKNDVIDERHFSDEKATDTERQVYDTFLTQRKNIMKRIGNILSYSNPIEYDKLNSDEKDYVDYVYKMLVKNGVLNSSLFNGGDNNEYNQYMKGKITLSAFLQHALSQENWIDRTKFSKADAFYNSEEIYNELLNYILTELSEDEAFSKLVYKTLVYNDTISGKQICLLLFDQNVIEYNKDDYVKVKSGSTSPYQFIYNKLNKLEITPGQLGLDPCSGSAIVTDPNTGKVQAMVSYPGYNNNLLANKIDSTYYSYLTNNSSYPLINRPIQQKTAPGSTYKMLSAITGLETGTINSGTSYPDNGEFTKVPPTVKCWKKGGHGNVNVVRALEVSCNVFFYNVSYDIGRVGGKYYESRALNALNKYANEFGFGGTTGLELPNEAKGQISTAQGISSYIGQGKNNYTPAILSKYITALANRGTLYDLSIIKDSEPKVANKLKYSSNTWRLVSEGNYKVVNGAGSSISDTFKNLNVKVAGKTGTAQESKKRPNHALFVSYAPADNPTVTVTTVIPNGYTSHNSAELASEIYEYIFGDENKKQELAKADVKKPENSTPSNE